ncbi:MAG: alcohol dehydrogenase catalytic domain-containing protein, partial [Chloroflexi bacterium]|nr:alcohol dehydrogenase catalytic domain-containing protein [Chloroflexota bacterium]
MSLPATSRAIVQTGPRSLELRELPLPSSIGPEEGLLRVEACGICGSDYEQYQGLMPNLPFPLIPGHEPVGTIAEIGEVAAQRWGVRAGDRVAVEALLPCGFCRQCRGGEYRLCSGRKGLSGYGYLGIETPPGLWGGYAEYLYLDPHTVLHPISRDVSPELATLFNPLGAGIRWAQQVPGTKLGDTIVILGPGQRGLCSVIAAREAGASCIIVSGLSVDERKLALAREFGAHHTIDVEREEIVQRVVRHPVDLFGCGRTDAGVHAAAHISNFLTDTKLPSRKIGQAIRARLPDDVELRTVREVDVSFHARRSAICKLYRYRIYNAPDRPVMLVNKCFHFWRDLDPQRMSQAARALVGRHDFAA